MLVFELEIQYEAVSFIISLMNFREKKLFVSFYNILHIDFFFFFQMYSERTKKSKADQKILFQVYYALAKRKKEKKKERSYSL